MHQLKAFGAKMFATHQGLSKLYEVSCPELDILVNAVKDNENVIGARMMGGGFGGCTINIIKTQAVANIIKDLEQQYLAITGKPLQHYIVSIEEGAAIL
jgi:galactokinase